jgi:hypothetical protein
MKSCPLGSFSSPSHRLDHVRLSHVLDYISAHVADEIMLVELAGVAGLTTFHFARRDLRNARTLRASSGGTASRPETDGEVSIILTLRPPELSGRDAEHLTEMTRQVALVGKPHGIRNLGQ